VCSEARQWWSRNRARGGRQGSRSSVPHPWLVSSFQKLPFAPSRSVPPERRGATLIGAGRSGKHFSGRVYLSVPDFDGETGPNLAPSLRLGGYRGLLRMFSVITELDDFPLTGVTALSAARCFDGGTCGSYCPATPRGAIEQFTHIEIVGPRRQRCRPARSGTLRRRRGLRRDPYSAAVCIDPACSCRITPASGSNSPTQGLCSSTALVWV
jgi:hypothetical protein